MRDVNWGNKKAELRLQSFRATKHMIWESQQTVTRGAPERIDLEDVQSYIYEPCIPEDRAQNSPLGSMQDVSSRSHSPYRNVTFCEHLKRKRSTRYSTPTQLKAHRVQSPADDEYPLSTRLHRSRYAWISAVISKAYWNLYQLTIASTRQPAEQCSKQARIVQVRILPLPVANSWGRRTEDRA